MTKAFCALLLLLCSSPILSQTTPKSFTVKYITELPVIDGLLDESFWETAEGPKDFQQYFPTDSVLA